MKLNKINITLILIFSMLMSLMLGSPLKGQDVLDGAYIREHNPTRKIIEHPHLREADAMWSKRVWRHIMTKQKMNFPLFYPTKDIKDRKSLYDVIRKGVLEEGSLTAYNPGTANDQDEFQVPMTASEAEKMFTTETTVGDSTITEDIKPGQIRGYRLKEIWYFDKQRSVLDQKIIGIAPLKFIKVDGQVTNIEPMVWLYFPECRYVFVNHAAFNPQNNSKRITFDDIFMKRRFDSQIIKESNVYDRQISQYKKGTAAILEGKRVKKEIFRFEHDLWSY